MSVFLTCTTDSSGRIELIVSGTGSGAMRMRFADGRWGGWAACAADTGSRPEPAASPHAFSVSPEHTLLHRAPDESGWTDLGGCITGGDDHVAVVGTAGGVDVFALWADRAVMRRSLAGGEWSQWEVVDLVPRAAATYAVLRPRDLVSLTVRANGVRERTGASGVPEWVADPADGRLIVDLPPQHVAETVLTSGSSSGARLAGPSSLHFVVPRQGAVRLSVEGVLAAMGELPLAVTPRVLGQASTLELPWRLLLALQEKARCVHRERPVSSGQGVTQVWHTRILGPSSGYAAVHPFASLPVEVPFANGTPLAGSVDDIAAEGASHPDQPVTVDKLILTTCGAWFSGSVSWPQREWTHRTSMGRDLYVRLLERGVLFPFGHRAAVVEVVERRFDVSPPSVAALRRTHSLIVTQSSRDYGVAAPHERAFPFQRVEIEPLQIVPLDPPDDPHVFWPQRDGEPVVFDIRASAAGDVVPMRLPLLFSDGTHPELLDDVYARGPRHSTGASPARPTAAVDRFMPLAMKNAEQALEGAGQHVHSLTFGGTAIAAGAGFHPRITGLEVNLPAVNQLSAVPVPPLPATLAPELLGSTLARPPDVLLQFAPRVLNLASVHAGVVAAPTMAVDRISRTLGPMVAQLPTDPRQLFDRSATLLGIVPLSEVIATVTGRPTITWSRAPHPSATLRWKERVTKEHGPFKPHDQPSGRVGGIELTVRTDVVRGRPPRTVTDGVVRHFLIGIPSPADPLVTLDFEHLTFHAETGALPTTKFKIVDAGLGRKLKFVQKLSAYLREVGSGGPAIDVTATSVRVRYAIAIPTPLGMGLFTLQNLVLQAGVTLSLTNQPITIDFAFGTRASPFLVTVMGFGGGGYLELGMSAGGQDGGLQRFVGGIEFGASVAMNFGVAEGEVHVFGGVVFTKQGGVIEITGYLRIGGSVRVLALISVSVELTISLTFVEPNVLRGAARLVIAVDLTFWSTSVEISCEKTFVGSEPARRSGDAAAVPAGVAGTSVQDALGPVGSSFPWLSYCRGFAGER